MAAAWTGVIVVKLAAVSCSCKREEMGSSENCVVKIGLFLSVWWALISGYTYL